MHTRTDETADGEVKDKSAATAGTSPTSVTSDAASSSPATLTGTVREVDSGATLTVRPPPFDFAKHEQDAISAYLKVRPFYAELASVIARVVQECLRKRNIKVQSVQHRAKYPESFGRKAATPSDQNPDFPKYAEPLTQITDLAGVRIISYLLATRDEIDKLLCEEFEIVEKVDKGKELLEDEKFGYHSVHYVIRVKKDRAQLAEYERFATATTEVQVRTILQDAWAEIEHDIQYKSTTSIPREIRRRIMALAGLLELADREFQEIQEEDEALKGKARNKVESGDLGGVQITPDALKLFLDKTLGADYRIAEGSYDYETRVLKRLGFHDLKQVENAINPYDDGDRLSAIDSGTRQGQLSRFELMLLAALGERFIEQHPLNNYRWFADSKKATLKKFKTAGIPTGTFTFAQKEA